MQRAGTGFYAGSSVYWDNNHDGKYFYPLDGDPLVFSFDLIVIVRECQLSIRDKITVCSSQRFWIECLSLVVMATERYPLHRFYQILFFFKYTPTLSTIRSIY